VKALWLPFEVADLDRALDFYEGRLGLARTDSWSRAGERGAVLRAAGSALIELVEPVGAPQRGAPLAFELGSSAEVDAAFARLGGVAPHRYPRGHYGFVLAAASTGAGAEVMLWSEAGT
jgi:catechol 2,3-dioxygenase-like lactoylglutathione lyase family enzyme